MNVYVIEDALPVRKRLVALLRAVEGVIVVGEAGSVRDGIEGVLHSAADTLLLDLQLEDGNGLDVLSVVKPMFPGMRVIVLSNLATDQHRGACIAAGADIVLDKSRDFGRVPEILRAWLSRSVTNGK